MEERTDFEAFAAEMQKKASLLLEEVELFSAHLKEVKKNVSLGDLPSSVRAVLKHLDSHMTGGKVDQNVITCSNFTFYETLWSVAKTCEGVTALRQTVYTKPKPTSKEKSSSSHTYVDIIASNGLSWIKVSRLNEKRVIWELAKSGWNADSDSEFDDDDDNPNANTHIDDSIGFLKTMTHLVQASQIQKVRYRCPSVTLILPELTESSKPVKDLLNSIRALGVTVQTATDLPPPLPLTQQTMEKMTADRFATFTSTLNIDCSVALAFASDLSHNTVEVRDWHNDFIARQIEGEIGDRLLPRTLWPACAGRKMVCTRESAEKVQEITDIVGSENERARVAILLGKPGLSQEQSVAAYQTLSDYDVPSDWQIPLEVVDVDIEVMKGRVPSGVRKVVDSLLEVNKATFLYGWTEGWTTVTSNGQVTRAIERVLEEGDGEVPEVGWPDVWVCSPPRSLVGKEVERDQKKRTAGAVRQSVALKGAR